MNVNRDCLYTALTLVLTNSAFASPESDTMTVWSSPVSSATTTILTEDTIKKLDKQNVAQALSVIPGVVLQKSGNRNEQQVKVRGFDNRQVPVFFDGVPVYIPYDGNLDLGRFLTSDIASVEVSKGYSSLLQGPNQMGGAINITTRRPVRPVEGSIGYREGVSRGSRNARDMHASLGASNDLGYFRLSGSQMKQDFQGLPHGTRNPVAGENGRMINSSANDKRGILKAGFTPRIDDEYTLTYINQQGQKDNPPYSGTGPAKSRYWQWPQYDKESYYYQGTTRLSQRITLKSRLYRDAFQNTLMMYNSLADLQNKQGNYSYYSDYSNGAGLQLATELREADLLSFAINVKDDVHREKGARNAPYDRYEDRTWSLASEYQWQVQDKLDLVAGLSYDWRNSLQGKKYQKDGSVTRYENNRQRAVNWQTMARYLVDDNNTLSLSYADRTRFPTLKERYTTMRPAYNQIAKVNPQLKPERARGIDLTWNGTPGRDWGYEVSVYYNRITDAIRSRNIDADTVQNQNSGRVDYTGIDLGIKGNPFSWLETGLNYSLIHAGKLQSGTGKVTDLPAQNLTAWLTLTPWEPLAVTLSEEARSSSNSNSDGSLKAAGFAITHLRADYSIGYGLSATLSVNNLFDTRYAYSEGFIEQGRHYWLGMEYAF